MKENSFRSFYVVMDENINAISYFMETRNFINMILIIFTKKHYEKITTTDYFDFWNCTSSK